MWANTKLNNIKQISFTKMSLIDYRSYFLIVAKNDQGIYNLTGFWLWSLDNNIMTKW